MENNHFHHFSIQNQWKTIILLHLKRTVMITQPLLLCVDHFRKRAAFPFHSLRLELIHKLQVIQITIPVLVDARHQIIDLIYCDLQLQASEPRFELLLSYVLQNASFLTQSLSFYI